MGSSNMICLGVIGIYFAWCSLYFLDMWFDVYSQFWKILLLLPKVFFMLSSLPGTLIMHIKQFIFLNTVLVTGRSALHFPSFLPLYFILGNFNRSIFKSTDSSLSCVKSTNDPSDFLSLCRVFCLFLIYNIFFWSFVFPFLAHIIYQFLYKVCFLH